MNDTWKEGDMIRTNTLKSFVEMHEHKLNAKLSGLRAQQLDAEMMDVATETTQASGGAGQHWRLNDADQTSRNRPKSHYFNFILTATH